MALPDDLDRDKLAEAALAILALTAFSRGHVMRAWKSLDWDVLDLLWRRTRRTAARLGHSQGVPHVIPDWFGKAQEVALRRPDPVQGPFVGARIGGRIRATRRGNAAEPGAALGRTGDHESATERFESQLDLVDPRRH